MVWEMKLKTETHRTVGGYPWRDNVTVVKIYKNWSWVSACDKKDIRTEKEIIEDFYKDGFQ